MARDIELARCALMRSVRRLTAEQVVQRLEGVVECRALLKRVLDQLDDARPPVTRDDELTPERMETLCKAAIDHLRGERRERFGRG